MQLASSFELPETLITCGDESASEISSGSGLEDENVDIDYVTRRKAYKKEWQHNNRCHQATLRTKESKRNNRIRRIMSKRSNEKRSSHPCTWRNYMFISH